MTHDPELDDLASVGALKTPAFLCRFAGITGTIAARDKVTLDPASMGRWRGMCEGLVNPLVEALAAM
jgi:hypothetical protein